MKNFTLQLQNIWWSIAESYKANRSLFVISQILTIILSFTYIISSRLEGNLINSFTMLGTSGVQVIMIPVAMYFGFSVVSNIIQSLDWSFIKYIVREKAEMYFTAKYMNHMGTLDIGRIEQEDFQKEKELMGRSLWRAQGIPGDVGSLVGSIFSFLLSAGIIFKIHPVASLCVLLGAIPNFFITNKKNKAENDQWEASIPRRRIEHGQTRTSLEDKHSALELFIANKWTHVLKRFLNFLDFDFSERMKVERKYVFISMIGRFLETLGIGVALYFIVLQAISGKMNIGDITFSLSVLYMVNSSLSRILTDIANIKQQLPHIETVRNFFKIKPFIDQSQSVQKIGDTEDIAIEFKNVDFHYPGGETLVLQNVSFSIPAGKKVALVGLNGAGKSTIIKLMLRMYDVTGGQVLINNQNIRTVNLSSWYAHIRILFQDFYKYTFLSIRETISLFSQKEKLEDNEIQELLQMVNGESIINNPDDLDKKQDNEYGGRELSGGQYQKIALARMLAQYGNMIILDEPTSAIDALSEEKVFETLQKLSDSITMLFISHRFSTIRNADHIIVLDGKTVAEQGDHETLMQSHGLYARMYKTQVLGEK
jgi:ATP-binding cassette subfamily B protein